MLEYDFFLKIEIKKKRVLKNLKDQNKKKNLNFSLFITALKSKFLLVYVNIFYTHTFNVSENIKS